MKNVLLKKITAAAAVLVLLLLLPLQAIAAVPDAVVDARAGVVRIYNHISEEIGGYIGTGFAVGESSYDYNIITNLHVITDDNGNVGNKLYAFYDTDSYVTLTVVAYSAVHDIAILSPYQTIPGIEVISLSTDEVKQGMDVYALGYPGAADGAEFDSSKEAMTLTDGIVSSIKTSAIFGDQSQALKYIQTNSSISGGNSGGPLLNEKGDVVGVNTLKSGDDNNMGIALHVEELISLLKIEGIAFNTTDDFGSGSVSSEDPDSSSYSYSSPSSYSYVSDDSDDNSVIIGFLVIAAIIIAAVVLLVVVSNKKKKQQQTMPYGQQPSPYGQQPAPYGQQPSPYGQPPSPYGQPQMQQPRPVAPPQQYGQPQMQQPRPAAPPQQYGQPQMQQPRPVAPPQQYAQPQVQPPRPVAPPQQYVQPQAQPPMQAPVVHQVAQNIPQPPAPLAPVSAPAPVIAHQVAQNIPQPPAPLAPVSAPAPVIAHQVAQNIPQPPVAPPAPVAPAAPVAHQVTNSQPVQPSEATPPAADPPKTEG